MSFNQMDLGLPPHSQKLFSDFHHVTYSNAVNNVRSTLQCSVRRTVHQYFQFAAVTNIEGCLYCCTRFRSLRGLSHSTANKPDCI